MQPRRPLLFACLVLACGPEPAGPPAAAGPPVAAEAAAPVVVAPAPASVPRPQHFEVAAVDAYVAAQVEKKRLIGVSLAIVKDGELVLAKGYGKRSLESGAAVEPDTAFAIGSVTKQFTCASVLLLAEEGRLALSDRAAKYYPATTSGQDITLADLLGNISGLPDYYPLDFVDERMRQAIEPDALLAKYATGPLDFPPGTRWSYSNTGFVLAGRVVEKVSGEALGGFLQRRIFGPAGMTHSSFAPAPNSPELATGYTTFALGEPIPAVPEASGWLHAAGAIHASATDLARWDLALMDGKIFKDPASWRAMSAAGKLRSGEPTDYGCGVGVVRRQGETVVQHSGAVSGFLAWNAMIPRTRSAVVLLTNADFVDAGALHGELLSLVIEADRPRPTIAGPGAREVAQALLRQMQAGQVDRGGLGDAFSAFLSDERVREAAPRLAALGEPTSVVVDRLGERGGMEVAVLRFAFAGRNARGLLYRSADGKVQEFLLLPD